MRMKPVQALFAVTLSMLMALGAPAGLAAQSAASPAPGQAQAQKPAATPAEPNLAPLTVHVGTQFMKDRGWFPIKVSPYLQRQLPEPVLENTPTLQQMIRAGKLQLSMADAIRLAIENNLNIDVYRYLTWSAETQVLSARGGANATGAPLDPQVTSSLLWSRNNIQVSNPFISGTGVSSISSITNKGASADFGYEQGFLSGTSLQMSFNNNRSSTTSPASLFNPSINSSLAFSVTQPLLRGFGFLPSEQLIIQARNNSQIARDNLATEVITVIANVETAYWNLAYTLENVQVQQSQVDWAKKNLQATQAQLRIGTLAQLDVVTAESTLATDQQNLIVAQTGEQQAETTLLNLIARNQMAAGLEHVSLVPTDSLNTAPQIDIIPYRDAVAEAWRDRPDLQAQELSLTNDNIGVRATRNALLPQLNLTGSYQSAGLAGDSRLTESTPTGIVADPNTPVVDANGNPVLINGQPVYAGSPTFATQVRHFNAGLLDSWNILWNQNYPSYSFTLSLGLPLHNRAAQAANANSLIVQREQATNVQLLKNSIATAVRNAQIGMQQGVARVQAAVQATKLAQESLNAEEKKFQLGVATNFDVILYDSQLATAQGNEINAKAGLLEAVVAFNQALGRTLQVHNISITDAAAGHVSPAPRIPGTPIQLPPPHAAPVGAP